MFGYSLLSRKIKDFFFDTKSFQFLNCLCHDNSSYPGKEEVLKCPARLRVGNSFSVCKTIRKTYTYVRAVRRSRCIRARTPSTPPTFLGIAQQPHPYNPFDDIDGGEYVCIVLYVIPVCNVYTRVVRANVFIVKLSRGFHTRTIGRFRPALLSRP